MCSCQMPRMGVFRQIQSAILKTVIQPNVRLLTVINEMPYMQVI
jgi:hypothetical protein